MGMKSRAKGKRGELEAAHELSRMGLESRRAVQYNGMAGDADLRCDAVRIHFEVKLQEQMHPYKWMAQAIADCKRGSSRKPVVIARRSRDEWLVIHRLSDWPEIAREINEALIRRTATDSSDSVRGEGEGSART
jgi:hypothetical protein